MTYEQLADEYIKIGLAGIEEQAAWIAAGEGRLANTKLMIKERLTAFQEIQNKYRPLYDALFESSGWTEDEFMAETLRRL